MHFSITAAFGGRLATLKLAHQSQQPAAKTGHMSLLVAIFFSSSAKGSLATSKAREHLQKLADCAL